RIDALGFAAAVADDRQHPQDAERILAMAEWEAVSQRELAKLGSLASFRALALNRIGFAAESDAVLSKATALIDEHATPIQQFFARQNRAWILFDRGEMAKAEMEFTHLRDHTDSHDLAGLADKEAWRARALFGTGRPGDALAAVEEARRLAELADVQAPLFLADLALTEGGLLYGRPEEAMEAADRVWDLVERQLPAWRNVVRSSRARALLAMGRHREAAEEIRVALEVTPPGSNGWRWRSRCHAIELEVDAADGKPFRRREAEDLADLFLQSEFYGWAAELLCVIAEQTGDEDVAREAMALATQVGNPMLAARAAHAGGLWEEPGAAPAIRGIKAMAPRLPEEWEDDWRERPEVAAALAAPEPAEDVTGAENVEILEEALRRAGLSSADTILSPAQRRSKGLVRHRRRRWSMVQLVAAVLGVIVLAGATSYAVAQVLDQDTPDTVVVENTPDTTAPEPLTLEQTQVELPVELLFGTSPDRGGSSRAGFVNVAGPRDVNGYYWVFSAADPVAATPLAYGNNLLVGSTDGIFQAIDMTAGERQWSLPTEARIDASAGIGVASLGEGRNANLVIVVGDDGVVRARDAVNVSQSQEWSNRLGAPIKSTPVVEDGVVYVATTAGVVHALELASGTELWKYPRPDGEAEAEPLGSITAGLAFHDGLVYVGTEKGTLRLIDTSGNLHCESDLDGSITVNPIVVDDITYISIGNLIRMLPAGECEVPISEARQFTSETVVDVAPAVVGNLIYVPNGQWLNAIDRAKVVEGVSSPEEAHHWSPGMVNAGAKISTPPVVTQDAVYFGTESGRVYAVDADTGEELWQWQTGSFVRASPVIVDGAAFLASGDGTIFAVGPAG
ncbi:MAG TPA: PQQ-binding-like beta-propeller repeat protein, partial [Acidimicrobiia bacterium]|nr:PQQ-binding-like beta-propeller repeat protein [Acidimicrobiia bacterium]